MFKHDISVKILINHYIDQLDNECYNLIDGLYKASDGWDINDCKLALQLAASSLNVIIQDMSRYLNNYNEAVRKEEIENIKLRNEIKRLEGIISQQDKQLKELGNKDTDILKKANDLMDLFEQRVEHLAKSTVYIKKAKEPKIGKDNPNFEHKIDNDMLVSQYIEYGGLTDEVVKYWQSRCSITYNGLRNRLIQLNVWKGHNKKGGNQDGKQ